MGESCGKEETKDAREEKSNHGRGGGWGWDAGQGAGRPWAGGGSLTQRQRRNVCALLSLCNRSHVRLRTSVEKAGQGTGNLRYFKVNVWGTKRNPAAGLVPNPLQEHSAASECGFPTCRPVSRAGTLPSGDSGLHPHGSSFPCK